jgi:thiol-disulfide isomerase/thioredoxin
MASRQKLKEMRREELRAARLKEARRHRQQRIYGAGAVVLVILVVIGILVGLKVTSSPGTAQAGNGSRPASAKVAHAVQNVQPSVFAKVGAVSNLRPPTAINGGKLTKNEKPEVVYVGADFCPFCAAERWPLAVTLSRFGTFHHLGATESATNDQFPGTKTLSFYGSTYTSKYLTFNSTEETTNQPKASGGYKKLETPSKKVQRLVAKYDVDPKGNVGDIPFIDVGNRWKLSVQYSPELLKGMSHAQIADAIGDPSSTAGKAIIGSANTLTATFCKLTDGKPGSVCNAPGVQAATKKLPRHEAGRK